MPNLPSGEEVGENSEAWRFHCEANYVAKMAGIGRRRDYLAMVEKKRSPAYAERLKSAVKNIWYNPESKSASA